MSRDFPEPASAQCLCGVQPIPSRARGTTFRRHVQVALDLHNIHQIVVIDHRDCGAYKAILGKDLVADPPEEFTVHAARMRSPKADIAARHPKLAVDLLLMRLDGKVETVA